MSDCHVATLSSLQGLASFDACRTTPKPAMLHHATYPLDNSRLTNLVGIRDVLPTSFPLFVARSVCRSLPFCLSDVNPHKAVALPRFCQSASWKGLS